LRLQGERGHQKQQESQSRGLDLTTSLSSTPSQIRFDTNGQYLFMSKRNYGHNASAQGFPELLNARGVRKTPRHPDNGNLVELVSYLGHASLLPDLLICEMPAYLAMTPWRRFPQVAWLSNRVG
jgi:hypothetical protein